MHLFIVILEAKFCVVFVLYFCDELRDKRLREGFQTVENIYDACQLFLVTGTLFRWSVDNIVLV